MNDQLSLLINEGVDSFRRISEAMRSHTDAASFDEVAILVKDSRTAKKMIKYSGLELFNSAHDRVMWTSIDGESGVYEVDYFFLHAPDDEGFRFEIMALSPGGQYSPVHRQAQELTELEGVPGQVVHVSYKPPAVVGRTAEESYLLECLKLAEQEKMPRIVDCRSTYGRFSYWLAPGQPGVFVKPRVNLRDDENPVL